MTEYSFAACQRALREASRLNLITASAAHTALWLETFADHKTGLNARPSVETLADIQQVTPDTVRRNLVLLRRAGYIERTHGHSRNRPATYRMTIPQASEALTEDSLSTPRSGDGAPVCFQSGGQSGGQSGDEKGVTTLTTITSDTYAPNRGLGVEVPKPLADLIEAVVEAIDGYGIDMPYQQVMDSELQATRLLADLLPALAADGIDMPVTYLQAIHDKDGAFQFGLAVREKWRLLVGAEKQR